MTMPQQDIQLQTRDGLKLTATHYSPDRDATEKPQFIVIGGATAVPRGFYRRFGDYAASRGLHVIAADYRGIGDSKSMCPKDAQGKPTLKGYEMVYADWSRYDLAAAVDYAARRGDVYLVGHSLGGHALGQLPNHDVVKAAYFCGSGAGWAGWMPRGERIKVWVMWNLIGPVATSILGYQPMSKMGIGEDLPMGAYRDWRRWCNFPHYFFDDPAQDAREIARQFAQISCPIAACVSTDDLWAPPASRDAFFKGYTSSGAVPIDISPAQLGVKAIGHMGYFRAQVGETLWPQILDWLGQHGLQAYAPRASVSQI
jgi:predicted alpha/beta hydrolase